MESYLPRFAELSPDVLAAIRTLERQMDDVCLLAVKKSQHLYALEAKVGINDWRPVNQVMRGLPLIAAYFASEEEAKRAKGQLKNYLGSTARRRRLKRPIRIHKIPIADSPETRDVD